MAKKTTSKSGGKAGGAGRDTRGKKTGTSVAKLSARSEGGSRSSDAGMGEAFIKLMQSPLVAELVAVAATAALAALAEHGFTSGGTTRGKRAGKDALPAGEIKDELPLLGIHDADDVRQNNLVLVRVVVVHDAVIPVGNPTPGRLHGVVYALFFFAEGFLAVFFFPAVLLMPSQCLFMSAMKAASSTASMVLMALYFLATASTAVE